MRNLLASLLPLMLLAGCWSDDPSPEPEIKEVKAKGANIVETPQEELLAKAKQLYSSGLYSVAKSSFQSLRDTYPLGPYAEFAELKIADCDFEVKDYEGAAARYDEFLKNRPSSPSASYAMLRLGRSQQFINKGIGRDSASLERALQTYTRLLEQHPSSVYARPAAAYKNQVMTRLAAQDRMIMDFYREQGQQKAYEARKAAYDAKWIPLLGEAATRQGESSEEDVAATPAGTPEPTPAAEVSAVEETTASPAPVPSATVAPEPTKPAARVALRPPHEVAARSVSRGPRISRVVCQPEKDLAILYLSPQDIADVTVPIDEIESDDDDTVTLHLPSLAQDKADTFDCFEEKDLVITPPGTVALKNTDSARVLFVPNPSRLVIGAER